MEAEWFSARCVFGYARDGRRLYEERVTVWSAATFDEAIALAEAEARSYAEDVDVEFTGFVQAYAMSEELASGAEVFSLMRDSELPTAAYLDRFFATGDEREQQSD